MNLKKKKKKISAKGKAVELLLCLVFLPMCTVKSPEALRAHEDRGQVEQGEASRIQNEDFLNAIIHLIP